MKPTPTTCRSVTISAVTQHSDGTESFASHFISPINEAACESVMRSLISCLFETPVDEDGAPSGFVPGPAPVTKIECSLQVFEDPAVVSEPLDLFDTQFFLGYD